LDQEAQEAPGRRAALKPEHLAGLGLDAFEEVRRLEAGRIGNDQTFAGPRPEWAGGG